MTDIFSKKKRSAIMSRVRGRDTKPERAIQKAVEELGHAYSMYAENLAGKPDLVLDADHVAIFVNGCFWHGHPNCAKAHLPSQNRRFWKEKLEKNRKRDLRNASKLRRQGWSVVTLWSCQEMNTEYVARRLSRVGVRESRHSKVTRSST